MIKVYVRNANEGDGHFLGEFEPVHLPQLIQVFKDNPTYAMQEVCTYSHHQFVGEADVAFFEIVVGQT